MLLLFWCRSKGIYQPSFDLASVAFYLQVEKAILQSDGDIGSLPLHDIILPMDELEFWADVTATANIPGP